MTIHLACKVQFTLLKVKKALITVSTKYLDFINVFSKKLAIVLLKHIKINTYSIDLEENKQPLYRYIYSLGLVELKTLKTNIGTNLGNSFICLSKSLANTPILFNQKSNVNFYLCGDY